MLPTLELGPWHVSTFRAIVIFVVVVLGMYAYERLQKLGYPPGVTARCLLLTVLAAYGGAYLMQYLTNLLRSEGSAPEGLSITWALVGGGITATLCCWRYGASLGRVLDLAVVPLPLGQAIARLGCLARGCCYGKPTDSWLGLYLPDEQGVWLVRYPTQLLSAVADLLIFFVLLAVERYGMRRQGGARGWPFDGFLILLYLVLFSSKRFVVAFFRASAVPVLGPLTWMQLYALIVFAAASALILWNLGRTTHRPTSFGSD
jgi:phosphatidylglycerol:prolipoprotein diacylglycerol transferase